MKHHHPVEQELLAEQLAFIINMSVTTKDEKETFLCLVQNLRVLDHSNSYFLQHCNVIDAEAQLEHRRREPARAGEVDLPNLATFAYLMSEGK